jgi:hypothetical protein
MRLKSTSNFLQRSGRFATFASGCLSVILLAATPGAAQDERAAIVAAIKTDVSAFRDLAPRRPVKDVFLTSNELRERFRNGANAVDDVVRRRDNVQFWLMRLSSDPAIDILDQQTQASGKQVLGFYSPAEKTLYVRNDAAELGPDARVTLAHEFTHALQDQHFDLARIIRTCSAKGVCDSDRALAGRAVVEGDATLLGFTYAQSRLSSEDLRAIFGSSGDEPSAVDTLPAFLRQISAFPYREGTQFVSEVLQRGDSYNALNRAYRDLPVSTEQILHPEKYLNKPRDLPKPVLVPNLLPTLGAGWRQTDNTNLGELGIRAWFAQLGAAQPDVVAAGWGGDRFVFYQNGDPALGGQSALVFLTRWDTENDAAEFVANVQDRLSALPREGELWRDGGRTYALSRFGDRIAWIASTDPAAAQKLSQRLVLR